MSDTGTEKKKPLVWMFLLGYLAYSSIYIARLNFSVASVLFEALGTLTTAQIGVIGSVFSFVYAFSKVPNGFLGDRVSSRAIIVAGLAITGISNLFIGFFPRFWSIAILWGLNAFGQSMLWGPLLRSFSDHYDKGELKTISSLLVSSVAFGSILGLLIASACATVWGAAACFLIPGAIACLLAVLVKALFLDSKTVGRERGGIARQVRRLFTNRKFRLIVPPALAHGMIKDNINVWIAVYFADTFGVNTESMAGFIFLIPLFALAGRLLYPVLYRVIKNEYIISSAAFFICAAVNVLLMSYQLSMLLSLICLGVISAMTSVINAHMLSTFPISISDNDLSFIESVMDLVTYGGAGIGSLLFGYLIGRFGYGSMFSVWAGISLASILFLAAAGKRKASLAVLNGEK